VAYAYDMDAEQARTTRRTVLDRYGVLAVSHLGTPFTQVRGWRRPPAWPGPPPRPPSGRPARCR
jgi:hypothetical protein